MIEPKIVYKKHFPPKGYIAITLWRWIIIREDKKGKVTPTVYNHEKIHVSQQSELLVIPFFLIYFYLIKEWRLKPIGNILYKFLFICAQRFVIAVFQI